MTIWRIRPAAPDDTEVLAAIEAAAFGAASWGAASLREGLSAPLVSALLAYDEKGDAPAGFALWRTVGEEGEILSIGAAPAFRRRGAGAALVGAILADAAREGLSAIFLEVERGNSAARALYEKFGFIKVGERARYYRNGADAIVMRKRL